jgi:hypothetical protein
MMMTPMTKEILPVSPESRDAAVPTLPVVYADTHLYVSEGERDVGVQRDQRPNESRYIVVPASSK